MSDTKKSGSRISAKDIITVDIDMSQYLRSYDKAFWDTVNRMYDRFNIDIEIPVDKTQENIKTLKNSLTRFNIKGVCEEDRAYLQMVYGFSDSEINSLFETYKKQLCNKIYDYGKEDRKKWHRS